MKKMSKKQMFAHSLNKYANFFSCPICQGHMHVEKDTNFICQNGHAFNIAKQGYIHFLHKAFPSSYDKTLFHSRQIILNETSLYKGVTEEIAKMIDTYVNKQHPTVIDMGCGEGSHLAHIREKASSEVVGIGFDISKDAIIAATNYNDIVLTSVADIAAVPLKESIADVIINVLSPSNYKEFNRITHDKGLIIKVIPNTAYLQEIRNELFNNDEEEQTYSNEAVIDRFHEMYDVVAEKRIQGKYDIDHDTLQHIFNMTPLTWNVAKSAYEQLKHANINKITMDVTILVGKKIN